MRLNTNTTPLAGLALHFFNCIMERPPDGITYYINGIDNQIDPPKHHLELYRACIVFPLSDTLRYITYWPQAEVIQSTQMLRKAGIKLRRKVSAKSFLEVTFYKGILEVPFITIDSYSHIILLNFVAFEQCYYHYPQIMTSYIVFMGFLVNSSTDSEHLQSKQIIDKSIGTHEEVMRVLNQMRVDIYAEDFYLYTVCEGINSVGAITGVLDGPVSGISTLVPHGHGLRLLALLSAFFLLLLKRYLV